MKRYQLFLIYIFLILAWSTTVFPQTRKNALPKLLSVREQQAVREAWLKKRLDTMLLPMMRQQKIDMWIVTNEEFHPDPVTEYIAPPLPYNGRRDFFIFADRGGDKLDRIALVRYPEEALKRFFEVLNPPGRDISSTLRRIVEERKPKSIALNMGGTRGATNGLTHDAYKYLSETLGQDYTSRFVSAAPLIVEYMDTRLPEELEHYRTAVELTDILTQRAFSNEVITPGKTTVGDVRWWFLQQVNNAGLDVWFQPDLRIQRQNQETGKTQQFLSVASESDVIQRGDVIHIDCGLNYLGLSTDWQKMGYVLRAGEKDAPEGLKKALTNTNRLQDALFAHIKPGAKGFEVYDAAMNDMKQLGIEAMIYSHSVGKPGTCAWREYRFPPAHNWRSAGTCFSRGFLHVDRAQHDDCGARVGRTESDDDDGRRRLSDQGRYEVVPSPSDCVLFDPLTVGEEPYRWSVVADVRDIQS